MRLIKCKFSPVRCGSCHDTVSTAWHLMPSADIQSLAELCEDCLRNLGQQVEDLLMVEDAKM
jgi:hypothetical protein